MKNTLRIENFLIFDKVEIDVKKITVFIGPQASGKSIAAKLLYIFYHLPEFVFLTAIRGGKKRKLNEAVLKTFCEIFPQYIWSDKQFSVYFETEYGEISFAHMPRKSLVFSVSEHYDRILNKIFTFATKEPEIDSAEMKQMRRFPEHIQEIHHLVGNSDWGFINGAASSLFIPAGRSFFASLENNVFSFLLNNIHIDYFLKEFGMIYERAKVSSSLRMAYKNENTKDSFSTICKKFIGGTYFRRQQKDYIKNLRKNLEIEVRDASSGQQELLPILFALFSDPSRFFLIEEIETHIFPYSQSDIIKYIISTQKMDSSERSFLFTTHSPYVLTIINNLAYAGALEVRFKKENKKNALDKLDKIYPENMRIKSGDLSAYFFGDKGVESIINAETDIIDAQKLDEISIKTSDDFDALIHLEMEEM